MFKHKSENDVMELPISAHLTVLRGSVQRLRSVSDFYLRGDKRTEEVAKADQAAASLDVVEKWIMERKGW